MNKKQRFGLILLGTGALSFVGFMKIQKEGTLGFLWMISSVLLLLFGFLLVVFGQDLKDRMEMKQRQQEENKKFRSIYSKKTQITTILGITYVIVFFATQNDSDIFSKMALNNKVFDGQIYRLISHMFVHANYMHLFGNAFVLFTVGSSLECLIGKIKYVLVYLISGLLLAYISRKKMKIEVENIVVKE